MDGNSLAQQLEALVNSGMLTEHQLDILLAGIKRISATGIVEQALREGDQAPDFSLSDQYGNLHSLSGGLQQGPVLLQFFRGDWCPFCQAQLQALSAMREQIRAQGALLLCISPETAAKHRAMQERLGLDLLLLSDPGGLVGNAYRIASDLSAAEREIYAELEIELTDNAESGQVFLPIPASYIVLPGGRISYSYIEPDFRRRIEPTEFLRHLQQRKAGSQH